MQKILLTPNFLFKNFISVLLFLPTHTAVDAPSPFLGANTIQLSEHSWVEIQPIRMRSTKEEIVII